MKDNEYFLHLWQDCGIHKRELRETSKESELFESASGGDGEIAPEI